MNPRLRALIQLGLLVAVMVVLCLIFPRALAFVEAAASELRYLWWLVLLVVLGAWLVWGVSRKAK